MIWIGLLRGINVTGHGLMKMAELRVLCESIGFKEPRTLLQSGNVVFGSDLKDALKVSKKLGDAIEGQFGFRPGISMRTVPEIQGVVKANPYPEIAEAAPSKLIVMFLEREADKAACRAAETFWAGPERIRAMGREVFVDYPNGQGQSKLTLNALEKQLGKIPFTGRNWNTVTKLLEMAAE